MRGFCICYRDAACATVIGIVEIEVRHLQLVTTVAAVGGLTKAGRQLHLSQSALSHQLRGVEDRLGTPLFLRVGKRMVPTAAGERLVKSAQEILESLAVVERAIHQLAGGERARLRVTVAGHATFWWLPAVLKRFRALHGNVEIQIQEPTAADAVADVLAGSVDLAIAPGTLERRQLHVQPLFRDEVVFAVAPGHRLAARGFADVADLGDDPLFVNSVDRDSGVGREIIAAAGTVPGKLAIAGAAATFELVQAGLGVAVVDRWAIDPQLRAGTLRALRITRKGMWRQWHAATLKELAASNHVRDFVALLGRQMPHRIRIGRPPVAAAPIRSARTPACRPE